MTGILRILYGIFLLFISPFLIGLMGLASCLGLDSCDAESPNEEWVERSFHLQLDSATVEEAWDTHGGFHGDGDAYIALSLTEGLESQIAEINAAYEGETKSGPWYAVSEKPQAYASMAGQVIDYRGTDHVSILPEITNGYFCLINNFDGKDEYVWIEEDSSLGGFWNWEFAVYDADALKLYYYESDM